MRLSNKITGIILFLIFVMSFHGFSEDITIGYANSFSPMTFENESGEPDGFVIELYTRIFQDIGHEAVFVTGPFKNLYQQVLSFEIDAFATLTRTPERENLFYWPEEPTHSGWGQLFVSEGNFIENIIDLRDTRIGMMESEAKGKSFTALMNTMNIPFEPVYFPTFEDVIQNVDSRKLFAGVANNLIVAGDSRIAPTGVVFAPTATYTTTPKDNTEIVKIVTQANKRLAELRDTPGSYYWKLYEKWLAPAIIERKVISTWLIALVIIIAAGGILSFAAYRLLKHKVAQRTAELRESLNEKEILLREIHHRVKNNLAIISSFFSIQILNSEDDKISEVLESSKMRIASMAIVHELLYVNKNLSRVDLKDYITKLLEELKTNFDSEYNKVKIELNIEDIVLDVDRLIPLGIIINEVLANSYKHAFTDYETAVISVNVEKREDNGISLIMKDNGKGMPANKMKDKNSGLGLILIKGLAKQIDSFLEINCSSGTEYKLFLRA